jgi:hypothetical protein
VLIGAAADTPATATLACLGTAAAKLLKCLVRGLV